MKDIKELTFEQALSELEEIVEKLEQGDIDLEDSIDIYERGTLLKTHCEEKLKSANCSESSVDTTQASLTEVFPSIRSEG